MKIFSKLSAYLASLLLVGLVLLILTEIIGRGAFSYSTMIADEYSGYLYLALVFLGLGYTFDEDGHIRINMLTSKLSKSKNRFIDILVGMVILGILAYTLYYAYFMLLDAKDMEMLSEAVSETPIYLTQIPMVLGLGVFLLSILGFLYAKVRYDS